MLPIWTGTQFDSGEVTIRAEFERIVKRYASIPASSPAVDRSDPRFAPANDILKEPRDGIADLGAFEVGRNPAWCAGLLATHTGSSRADVITGTSGPDVIVGGGGDDIISGLGGDDVICGSGGDDTIVGGDGADELRGGKGADRVEGGKGADWIVGGEGNDRLVGNTGGDLILGHGGNDRLLGNEHDDVLVGGRGEDFANGGKGSDRCSAETAEWCELPLEGVEGFPELIAVTPRYW